MRGWLTWREVSRDGERRFERLIGDGLLAGAFLGFFSLGCGIGMV